MKDKLKKCIKNEIENFRDSLEAWEDSNIWDIKISDMAEKITNNILNNFEVK